MQAPGSAVPSGRKFVAEQAERVDQIAGAAIQPVYGFAAEETEPIRSARAAIQPVPGLAAREAEAVDRSARAANQPVLGFVLEEAGRAMQ